MIWASPLVLPDEHVTIGSRMKDCRSMLMLVLCRSAPRSRIHDDAVKAIDALDRLRTRLDCHLYQTVAASRDPRQLLALVYSGADHLTWREYDPDELDRDAFAAWALGQ